MRTTIRKKREEYREGEEKGRNNQEKKCLEEMEQQ